ncbi:sialidase family protein [Filimonas effusa]|uniref:sialidase family protein n=1 Tax=Filimonas effusa TaxID=2508721 RepID=UPI001FE9A3DE|nr:sialidase family protein [Filimonas effusa]
MKRKLIIAASLWIALTAAFTVRIQAQEKAWRAGIVTDEFIYEKAPYPQCHSATIAETPKGLVAAYFGGTRERNPDVCIYVSRNINGKWQEPVNVANGIQNDSLRYPTWNPVLYQVPGGELLLFYKIGPKPSDWKGWLMRSKDAGATWSKPESLPEGFSGPIKNKPVLVGNELFCPSSTEGKGWNVHFEVTADNGKTWRKVGPIGKDSGINAIQPSLLKYKKGKILQVLCRSMNRSVVESHSTDGGKTWTDLTPIGLPNNNSGTDAVTLRDGRQLIVYNHVKPADSLPRGKGARTPLNVAISKDGKKWYAALILEDSPISQYSYPSVIQSADGMVHFVYTWRREKIKYVKVDPSKLKLKRIKNEKWPGFITKTTAASNEEE